MWGYYERHSEPVKTPFEECKETLISIWLEQKKKNPDADLLSKLRYELAQHNIDTQKAAFDAVLDTAGW
jgi:hypothetical protein